jgi:hypothetical protein
VDRSQQIALVDTSRKERIATVRRLTLLSGFFLVLQVAATDYGTGAAEGVAVFWLVVGAFLLGLVYRKRSRLSQRTLVVVGLLGAVLYGLGALTDGRSAFLSATYLGQVLPLMAGPVRRHVEGD